MKLGNYIVIISYFVKPVNGDSKFYFALVTKSQKLLEHHSFVFGGSKETQTEKSKSSYSKAPASFSAVSRTDEA